MPVVNGSQEAVLLTCSVPDPEWIPEPQESETADTGLILHSSSISLDLGTLLSIQAVQRKHKLAWAFTRKCRMFISLTDMNLHTINCSYGFGTSGPNSFQNQPLCNGGCYGSPHLTLKPKLWIPLQVNAENKIKIQKSRRHTWSLSFTVHLSITFWYVTGRVRTKISLLVVSQSTEKI